MARAETIAVNPSKVDEPLDFDRLVAEQHARVTRLVSRLLGWSTDVPDVVQDVFVAALESAPRFEGRCRMDTWLARIAINACRSHRRKQMLRLRRRRPLDDGLADASTAVLDVESVAAVRVAIRNLPASDREVIVLRYLEEMPVRDIAAIVGSGRNAVDVRLHRARKRLGTALAHLMQDETR